MISEIAIQHGCSKYGLHCAGCLGSTKKVNPGRDKNAIWPSAKIFASDNEKYWRGIVVKLSLTEIIALVLTFYSYPQNQSQCFANILFFFSLILIFVDLIGSHATLLGPIWPFYKKFGHLYNTALPKSQPYCLHYHY